jgi:hypothetical protein
MIKINELASNIGKDVFRISFNFKLFLWEIRFNLEFFSQTTRLRNATKIRLVVYAISGTYFSLKKESINTSMMIENRKIDTFCKNMYSFIFFSPLRLSEFIETNTIGNIAKETILKYILRFSLWKMYLDIYGAEKYRKTESNKLKGTMISMAFT